MIQSLLLIPLASAILGLFLLRSQRSLLWLSVVSSIASLVVSIVLLKHVYHSGPIAFQWAQWRAPFGISFVADLLSLTVLVFMYLISLCVSLSGASLDTPRKQAGFSIFQSFLLFGATGALLTGDFFNLYVWFEVLLISSFGLLSLGCGIEQLRGTAKYLVINLVGSIIFLTGAGLIYGFFGTLNMADVALQIRQSPDAPWVSLVAAFLFVAFSVKAGSFPFFGWLPASYHTPPALVTALFSGILTKVGVYVLIRTYGMIFPVPTSILIGVSIITMLVGVFGALSQMSLKRLLSFHIVSQTGYMILGLALHTSLGLAAAIFHLLHNIVVKTNLLLLTSRFENEWKTDDLKKLGGLSRQTILYTLIFLASALALAGLPPLSGFFSKLGIVQAAWQSGEYLALGAAFITGLLTLMSMIKIWNEVFWKPAPKTSSKQISFNFANDLPLIFLSLLAVTAVFYVGPLMNFLSAVGDQILQPDDYIRAVLGRSTP